jgi:hypothetical protein
MIEVTAAALATHPFLHGMSRDQLGVLAESARDVRFPARHRLFDAAAVREHCAADPELGYELNQRITRVLAKRLQATRIRLIARSGHAAAVH